MLESGTELIEIIAGEDYMPTKTSADKRNAFGLNTSLAYWQIGADVHHGNSFGPVFKIEFVDLTNVPGEATHIQVWGVQNPDADAPIWPITYFSGLLHRPELKLWFKKFEFVTALGATVEVDESLYTVMGYKKRNYPMVW